MATTNAKSLVLRARMSSLFHPPPAITDRTTIAETRRTYRAVFAEPRLVIPESIATQTSTEAPTEAEPSAHPTASSGEPHATPSTKKRTHEDGSNVQIIEESDKISNDPVDNQGVGRKKKRKKNQDRHRGLTA